MLSSGSEATERGSSGGIRKNPKACEECRRKKQRCDGEKPCSACTRRKTSCSYRDITRHRGRKPLSSTFDLPNTSTRGAAGATAVQCVVSENGEARRSSIHIFNNIHASHEASGTETYYGASSNFSLLAQIYAQLQVQAQPTATSDSRTVGFEVKDGTEGIMRYNYQNIAFDKLPPPLRGATHCSFLSHDVAKGFLRNFLLYAIYRTPFLESEKLCKSLDQLYGQGTDVPLDPIDKSLIIIALAIGALPTLDSSARQNLISQAYAEAETMMYDISLRAVQVSLLMAQIDFDTGKPNMCYLQLGSAIRKAFASGIHRSTRSDAKKTMWSLFCNETLICVKLGRPYGLTVADLPPLAFSNLDYFSEFSRLCMIVRSAYKIYEDKESSIAADLAQANSVFRRMEEFASHIKDHLGLDMDAQLYVLEGEKLFWHISISYLYYFAIMLLYRPFLVLRIEYERRLMLHGTSTGTIDLHEASLRCTQSARSIIQLSCSIEISTEAIHNYAYHLESASFVLVLAASQPNTSSHEFVELVKTAIGLLRKLASREPATILISALEQMLHRLNAILAIPSGVAGFKSQLSTGLQRNSSQSIPMTPASELTATAFDDTTLLDPATEQLENLWSVIDWDMAFPSFNLEIPTSF